jgi:hypothetical protein
MRSAAQDNPLTFMTREEIRSRADMDVAAALAQLSVTCDNGDNSFIKFVQRGKGGAEYRLTAAGVVEAKAQKEAATKRNLSLLPCEQGL